MQAQNDSLEPPSHLFGLSHEERGVPIPVEAAVKPRRHRASSDQLCDRLAVINYGVIVRERMPFFLAASFGMASLFLVEESRTATSTRRSCRGRSDHAAAQRARMIKAYD
jgi:hypothetical protein